MSYRESDTVVVVADLPAQGLKRGDLGAVVRVLAPSTVEVEFVTASGHTRALVTLGIDKIRPVTRDDLLTVRPTVAA